MESFQLKIHVEFQKKNKRKGFIKMIIYFGISRDGVTRW